MFSLGDPSGEFHSMYFLSHCLARIPKTEAARLSKILIKKRLLIQRALVSGEVLEKFRDAREDMVALTLKGMAKIVNDSSWTLRDFPQPVLWISRNWVA